MESCSINIVQSSKSSRCGSLPIDLKHVLTLSGILCWVIVVIEMLMDRYILQVVIILLFAAQSKFCGLVELVSITLTWNIHHKEIFPDIFDISLDILITGSCVVRPICVGWMRYLLILNTFVILSIHAQITVVGTILVVADSSYHTVGTYSRSSNG